MLVYLAILAVLLIDSEVKNITEISLANNNDAYKDLEYNDLNISSDCESKTCVLKCCGFGQVLNDEGVCNHADNIEELNRIINYVIKVDKWNFTYKDVKVKHRKLYHNFAFLQNEDFAEENDYKVGQNRLKEFYILKNGFLKIKVNSTADLWLLAAPFNFCINTQLSNDVNEQEETRIIVEDRINSANTELLRYITGGMLVSLLLLGLVIYRMSSAVKRIFGSVVTVFTFCLVAVYILTAVQIIVLRVGVLNSTECRIISPFLYFFLLSSFFWVNIISYDAWNLIRNFRQNATKINTEVDSTKFIRFSIFGWVIPFMMTTVVVIVDILKLDLVFDITKPPFENCLVNGEQMMYYTHVPMSILMATNCMFFLMNIYNILMLQRKYYNNVIDITATLVSKRRYIQLKVLAIVGVSLTLEFMPHVPIVLYYSIHANNILLGGALCIFSIYEKCTYREEPEFGSRSNFMILYGKLTGIITKKPTISTIFMSQKNSDDLQQIISATSNAAATHEQLNKF